MSRTSGSQEWLVIRRVKLARVDRYKLGGPRIALVVGVAPDPKKARDLAESLQAATGIPHSIRPQARAASAPSLGRPREFDVKM